MLTFPLQCFPNDKNIFHINFTRSLTLQWKLLVMAKNGELFESKILVNHLQLYYSTTPITCTQTWIHCAQLLYYDNRWSAIHYDISLERTSLQRYIVLLCEILLRRLYIIFLIICFNILYFAMLIYFLHWNSGRGGGSKMPSLPLSLHSPCPRVRTSWKLWLLNL